MLCYPMKDQNNVVITDNKAKAVAFNNFFGSDSNTMPDVASCTDASTFISAVDFSVNAVMKTLSKLKPSTSCGQ